MRASALSLRKALAIVLFLSSHVAAAQSGAPPSAVGADRIRAILTEQPRWTVYWSTGGAAPRPPASAGSGTVEFTRHGDMIRGHTSIPAMSHECDFEVVVTDRGFMYPGCPSSQDALVRGPAREITYDPDDPEYPFKGSGSGYWNWFRPR